MSAWGSQTTAKTAAQSKRPGNVLGNTNAFALSNVVGLDFSSLRAIIEDDPHLAPGREKTALPFEKV